MPVGSMQWPLPPLGGVGGVFPACGCPFLLKALPGEGAHAMSSPLSVAPEPWPGNPGGLRVGTTSVENVRCSSGASGLKGGSLAPVPRHAQGRHVSGCLVLP